MKNDNLSEFFNIAPIENEEEIIVKSILPFEEQKYEMVNTKEQKKIENEARLHAIKNIKDVSAKGTAVLDQVINSISKESDMEYTESGIDPKMIASVASLINAISNANGKLLDDGKKLFGNVTTNTQNNVTVKEERMEAITTSDILKQIKAEKSGEFIEGEFKDAE